MYNFLKFKGLRLDIYDDKNQILRIIKILEDFFKMDFFILFNNYLI